MTLETLVIVIIVSIAAALIGALVTSRIQHTSLQRVFAQQQAWERAQEAHRRDWQTKQEKHITTLETYVDTRTQQIQQAWEDWQVQDQERVAALTKQYETSEAQLHAEREIARLPRIEDAPLITDSNDQHRHTFPNWQPPQLQGANLSEYNFSHLYLGHADLRNARLTNANFFMADLSGAYLTGADLSGADLSGANLSGADLRDALLTNANMHVADMQGAILIGTDLIGARHLTTEQVYAAVYDDSTKFDPRLDITRPRLRRVTSTTLPAIETDFTPLSAAPVAAVSETPIPSVSPSEQAISQPPAEFHFLSQLTSGDSLLDPELAGLLLNTGESTHTEEPGLSTPSEAYSS